MIDSRLLLLWVVVDLHQVLHPVYHDPAPAQVPPHPRHHQGVGQDQDHGQSLHSILPWRREEMTTFIQTALHCVSIA